MIHNEIVDLVLARKSTRRYTEETPSDKVITTVVRAGQQAPFSFQFCSLLLSRQRKKNPFHAPLLFTICIDSHRLELIMAKRKWRMVMNDLSLLFFGIQDAALMAENMVIAAESVGMASCFLGETPYQAETIAAEYQLPQRVFPLVQLAMGYPGEDPPPRPRYPLAISLFEDEYPELDDELLQQAIEIMDEGYLAQDYYRKDQIMIPLGADREETFSYADYSWTEHISRKAGLWLASPDRLVDQLTKCGFQVGQKQNES